MPHAYPKWQTAYHYFACWRDNGTSHRVLEQLLRPAGHECVLMSRRWVVERTLGWFRWCRHLSRDYERSPQSAEAWIYLASMRLLLRHLA